MASVEHGKIIDDIFQKKSTLAKTKLFKEIPSSFPTLHLSNCCNIPPNTPTLGPFLPIDAAGGALYATGTAPAAVVLGGLSPGGGPATAPGGAFLGGPGAG